MLARQRLDFDDTGAGLGKQERGIGSVVDLTEIDDGDSGQRRRAISCDCYDNTSQRIYDTLPYFIHRPVPNGAIEDRGIYK